jgi:hypothetical protein
VFHHLRYLCQPHIGAPHADIPKLNLNILFMVGLKVMGVVVVIEAVGRDFEGVKCIKLKN